jgi:type I restriction enzyme S subunit
MKKGWQTKKLGEVLEKTETVNPLQSPNAEFDYIDVSSVSNTTFEIQETQRLKGKDAPSRARKLVRTNDIIFATIRPMLQRIAVVPEHLDKQVCSTGYFVLRPKQGIDHRFVFYSLFTENFTGQMESLQKGASYPAVTDGDVRAQEIPVPPLAAQQRIVGLLKEAFEGIATAKANAEKNLQNARALFESHLQSVFTQRGPGWVEKRLADIADFKNGLNFTRQSNGQTLRMVGVGDFQEHSVVPIETLQSVTIDGKLSDDYLIHRDDILTVRSNGSKDLVGRCMLVPDVDGMTSFSGFIIRIRFDTRALSPRFLLHFMKSSATRERLTRDGGGANISNINQAKLSELPVSLPSFKQQEEIANRLDDLHEETQRLARLYERKLAALEALKKSLLHQAFSGEL